MKKMNEIILLCLNGVISSNEYFAIVALDYMFHEIISWASNCPDYPKSSILQYIGNWSGSNLNELITDLYEDILEPLFRENEK